MPKSKPSKTVNLLPAPGYILIEPAEVQSKTSGGIYLPETATTEKPQRGKVLAIGDAEITESGVKKTAPVKPGDVVVYKKWGGTEIKENGKDLLFVKFDDILAIVK